MTLTAGPITTPRTERRQNCFDALRLLAAVSVVVGHANTHLGAGFLWYRHDNGLWFFDGVMAFFILSGGMVYASADRCRRDGRPMREYLRNRFLRIVPALYAYFVVVVAVLLVLRVVPIGAIGSTPFLAWAVSNLALIPVYHPALFDGFGVGVLNGSLWTIPVEVSFYLVLPGLVWLAHRIGFRAMVALAFAGGVTGTVLQAALGGPTTELLAGKLLGVTFWPWLAFFVIGIALGRIWTRLPHHWTLAAGGVLLYTAGTVIRHHTATEWSMVVGIAVALPLAYLLFWLGHYGPAALRRMTERMGDLSFGVYIWHMPVINLLIWSGIAGHFRDTVLVTAVIGLTCSLAFASWHLVEKPALRLKRYSSRAGGGTKREQPAPQAG
ncbi:acyltransferase family protein [Micromonospora echinaurantiaca]|uniref:acyltransferase family protein n=1 Tax=Micromonospora echinaurantiaca TaxID=47857 RepID=UPI003789662D